MLKSKSVAKFIETTLNENDKGEKFRVVYEVGSYKGADINCILKQGKGNITPIANYTNVKTPFTLEIIVPIQCGEDRVDTIVDIVNDFIVKRNGRVKNIDNGKAVFLFNPLEIGSYETRATTGQSVLIKVEFFVEYSTNTGTKYEMALINNPFEIGTKNVGRFNTEEEQISWFLSRMQESNAPFFEVLSPNINSIVISRQRYLNPRDADVNDILMYNYAIIKETKWNDDVNYYYYYVTNADIDQYNIATFDLKMDTIQTFYNKIQFGNCFISRAHLDRFIDNNDGTVAFNTKIESPLFEREDFKNLEKRLVKREVVAPFQTGFNDLDKWYNDNIQGWIYMYLAGTPTYKVADAGKGENAIFNVNLTRLYYETFASEKNLSESVFFSTLACLAFPVYKTDNRIKINAEGSLLSINPYNAIREFIDTNGSDNIYALKFSLVPPFNISSVDNANLFSVDEDNLIIPASFTISQKDGKTYSIIKSDFFQGTSILRNANTLGGGVSRGNLILNCTRQSNINIDVLYNYSEFNSTKIYKSTITTSEKRDLKLNPKLYNSDYMSLKISDNTQNGADYDILKLSASGSVWIRYSEALTPDITKTYIRCYSTNSNYGIYDIGTISNLTGFVGSDDKSLVYESDKFRDMLANNKNFFLQNSVNNASGFIDRAVIGAGISVLSGNPLGAVSGAVGAISSLVTNKINQNLDVDSLRNAPATISGALGNVIFNSLYSDLGIVVETYDILPFEKQIIDDQMHMNGFAFNKFANIKDYDNKRKYFNFVQANVENIIGDISTPIREDIRQRFADGVRFWNVDDVSWGAEKIDYSKENYERWLEA
jgi:hypothetical protein